MAKRREVGAPNGQAPFPRPSTANHLAVAEQSGPPLTHQRHGQGQEIGRQLEAAAAHLCLGLGGEEKGEVGVGGRWRARGRCGGGKEECGPTPCGRVEETRRGKAAGGPRGPS